MNLSSPKYSFLNIHLYSSVGSPSSPKQEDGAVDLQYSLNEHILSFFLIYFYYFASFYRFSQTTY